MPHLITRQEAINTLEKEIAKGECIACRLVNSQGKYLLHKGARITVLLSEYPRCWGQVMVIANRHITSFGELETEEWNEMSLYLHAATRTIEQVLKPLRCYVAATGAADNQLMTTPHLHFNIIPVYHKTDKPATIFTWEHGLYAGTEAEWKELSENLHKAWKDNLLFLRHGEE